MGKKESSVVRNGSLLLSSRQFTLSLSHASSTPGSKVTERRESQAAMSRSSSTPITIVDHVVEPPSNRALRFDPVDNGEQLRAVAQDYQADAENEMGGDVDEVDTQEENYGADQEEAEEEEPGRYDDAIPKPSRRVQFCDGGDYEDSVPASPHPMRRQPTPSYPSVKSSPRSPLKKFAPLQDRRVNAILLEALQLAEFSSVELTTIEKSVKRLRDAIHGFALLVDKQVNFIGAESLEERGRVRADIMDLCENLKTSNALLESTCARMKKTLSAGKNQIHVHKRKLVGRAVQDIVNASSPTNRSSSSCGKRQLATTTPPRSPTAAPVRTPYTLSLDSCSSPGSASPKKKSPTKPPALFSTSKSPTRVPFATLLRSTLPDESDSVLQQLDMANPSPLVPPEVFESVIESVGLAENEFLDLKGVTRFLHEALTVLIARSSVLTFLGKAYHRKLLPQYASELARLVMLDLEVLPQTTPSSPIVVPANTFFDYMSGDPFRFDALMHILRVNNTTAAPKDPPSVYSPSPKTPALFQTPAFPTAANEAAIDTFGVNPFAQQLTRNGGLINGGQVVSLVVTRPSEPETLESAEQTLAMAKLLHDLATAESEARAGSRISIRPPDTRSREFSRAYLAASKQLLEKEASGGGFPH